MEGRPRPRVNTVLIAILHPSSCPPTPLRVPAAVWTAPSPGPRRRGLWDTGEEIGGGVMR